MRASILCLMLFVAGADLAAAEETPVAAVDDWNRTLHQADISKLSSPVNVE